jgi:hypothetical protein
MRTKIKRIPPDTALLRIMDALAQEAIEASDEEVTEAAADLRMDLNSRESAAFAGLTYFVRPQVSDFFSVEVPKALQAPVEGIAGNPPAHPTDRQRPSKRLPIAIDRKRPEK